MAFFWIIRPVPGHMTVTMTRMVVVIKEGMWLGLGYSPIVRMTAMSREGVMKEDGSNTLNLIIRMGE